MEQTLSQVKRSREASGWLCMIEIEGKPGQRGHYYQSRHVQGQGVSFCLIRQIISSAGRSAVCLILHLLLWAYSAYILNSLLFSEI